MVIALAVFTACCVFTCMAVYAGLGTVDRRLTTWNDTEATKVSESQKKEESSLLIERWLDDCMG